MRNMTEEQRLIFKQNLEKVLSQILSAKYDCNITIRLREKEALEIENSDTKQEAEPPKTNGSNGSTDR